MRAVNLMPMDTRRGAGAGVAGRSGGGVFVLLGGLTVAVALLALWAVAGRDASRERTELAALRAQAATATQQATALAPYGTYAQIRAARAATVKQLADTRFDWSKTLDAIARLMPANVKLSTLSGALPGAKLAGNSGAAVSDGTSTAMTVVGCAPSMAAVAELMPRLRAVPGVTDVTLTSSTHGGPGGVATAQNCDKSTFQMGLALAAPATPAAAAAAPVPAAPAGPAPAPAPAGAGR